MTAESKKKNEGKLPPKRWKYFGEGYVPEPAEWRYKLRDAARTAPPKPHSFKSHVVFRDTPRRTS